MTASPGPDLPADLADALGDAIYRAVDDADRGRRIEALVAGHPEHAPALRAAAALWTAAIRQPAESMPEPFAAYVITARLGRGGFGDVYLATQQEPVRRQVALKVLKRGMDSESILRRFAREQQALARMDHEAVARFYDAGTTPGGQPYFVMEYVEGQPVGDYCEAHGLGLRERLLLFVAICRGVQHAHQRGVVHRDLKPSNVLVARRGAVHAPKLIDFGIARALEQDDDSMTRTGGTEALGTPAYMAPEQAGADVGPIDTRTDVYALGALLCEMLTGYSPLGAAMASSSRPLQARELLRAVEPMRPSQIEPPPGHAGEGWRRALRGDLDWIVLMAMRREPDRRYAAAAELAADVERHLQHEPVQAGPPTVGYRAKKLLRKHRAPAIAAGLVLLTAIVGALVALDYAGLASARAAEAKQQAERLDAKVREFNLLAGVVEERRARELAPKLHPAWPRNLAGLRQWLDRDFAALQALRPQIEAATASLRRQALPWTEQELEAARRSHPRHGEQRALMARAAWLERELAMVGKPAPQAQAPASLAALDPQALRAQAWLRVAPNLQRTVWGEEEAGLALARLALQRTAEGQASAELLEALAWALVANGQDGEARATADRMVAAADEPRRRNFEVGRQQIELAITRRAEQLEAAQSAAAEVGREIDASQGWRFGADVGGKAAEFLHSALDELSQRCVALEREEAIGVRARLRWAQWLADGLSTAHPKASFTWEQARQAVAANARYQGQQLAFAPEDVQDLVPIGQNPVTGLLEFYHLPSAWDGEQDPFGLEIPRHEPDGSLVPRDGIGIVFVLVPGGLVRLGAQGEDPSQPHYDPSHDKAPSVHQIQLSPFFVARHELTQTQWRRLWRGDDNLRNPSGWGMGQAYGSPRLPRDAVLPPLTGDNPVEKVSWTAAQTTLSLYGLRLPTLAQWEYAGRAGCDGPWHTGTVSESLFGNANLLDQFGSKAVPQWGAAEPFDDGHIVHCRVGTFPANAFGLHEVHGNVFEWCLDEGPSERDVGRRAGDGMLSGGGDGSRCLRGGCYAMGVRAAAFGFVSNNNAGFADAKVGLRASRPLRGSVDLSYR